MAVDAVSAPVLPVQIKISECRVFIWNIKAKGDQVRFKAICKFEPNCKVKGGPESGQNLDAQCWENENFILSLGTDDGDCLNYRAYKSLIPKRFATQSLKGLSWVNYIDNGLEIEVPNLLKNEYIELRFSIAWKEKEQNEDDIDTWLAAYFALS
ncbi:MAG: hypothetical protein ACK41P_00555 [Asticcacaulis sp.]